MANHRRNTVSVVIMIGALALGVVLGSVYSGNIASSAVDELREYITDFFENNIRSKPEIFLASLIENLPVFLAIFFAGFFKLGSVLTVGVGIFRGFVSGFTAATLMKLMGWRGFLLTLSGAFSAVVFAIALVFFGGYSINFGILTRKREFGAKKEYLITSAIFMAIFCVSSFLDGYITTIFMDFIVTRM